MKMRKTRHKISVDEWKEKVAWAQELRDAAEQGQLSDLELRKKLELLCGSALIFVMRLRFWITKVGTAAFWDLLKVPNSP